MGTFHKDVEFGTDHPFELALPSASWPPTHLSPLQCSTWMKWVQEGKFLPFYNIAEKSSLCSFFLREKSTY